MGKVQACQHDNLFDAAKRYCGYCDCAVDDVWCWVLCDPHSSTAPHMADRRFCWCCWQRFPCRSLHGGIERTSSVRSPNDLFLRLDYNPVIQRTSQLVLDEKEIDGRRRCNLVTSNIPFDFTSLVCSRRDSALGLANNPPFEVVPGGINNAGECSRIGTRE